jgi:hypothetical protein
MACFMVTWKTSIHPVSYIICVTTWSIEIRSTYTLKPIVVVIPYIVRSCSISVVGIDISIVDISKIKRITRYRNLVVVIWVNIYV